VESVVAISGILIAGGLVALWGWKVFFLADWWLGLGAFAAVGIGLSSIWKLALHHHGGVLAFMLTFFTGSAILWIVLDA
jgi:hypothetical protein